MGAMEEIETWQPGKLGGVQGGRERNVGWTTGSWGE